MFTVILDTFINLVKSASRCRKNLFKNFKDEIILEVFKINHLQAYEKEHWRLRGYEKIVKEEHQNCLLHKREIFYGKTSDMGTFL